MVEASIQIQMMMRRAWNFNIPWGIFVGNQQMARNLLIKLKCRNSERKFLKVEWDTLNKYKPKETQWLENHKKDESHPQKSNF